MGEEDGREEGSGRDGKEQHGGCSYGSEISRQEGKDQAQLMMFMCIMCVFSIIV